MVTTGQDVAAEGATKEMTALFRAVRKGSVRAVPELVAALSDAERRACLPVFKKMRRQMREDPWDQGFDKRLRALRLAGSGCCTGAAAAAQWLASRDLAWSDLKPSLVLATFAGRDAEWIGDVAHRLAARPTIVREEYRLVEALVRRSGCAVPTSDEFVLAWVEQVHLNGNRHGRELVDDLREDPFLSVLAARLFEVADVGGVFDWTAVAVTRPCRTWPGALAQLAEEKVLDRGMLLDGCLSLLLRGADRLSNARGFLKLLDALEPTEDENAERVVTWVRLLPDTHSTVAARAQQVLGTLDAAGRLETEHLVEASRAVLFRPEKKLVRAQLILLDKAVRRDRSRAGELLLAAADAFGHEDHTLQERALALVARHLRHAGDAVLPELIAGAGLLGPGLRGRAAEVFGTEMDEDDGIPVDPGTEILPPVPEPERLDTVVPSPAELAEEVGVLLEGAGSVAECERALNGLVVHAHRDRDGLVRALEPVVRRYPLLSDMSDLRPFLHGVAVVVSAVLGGIGFGRLREERARIARELCPRSAFGAVMATRTVEAAQRIIAEPLPFLLATPTWSSGAIDPAVLVERLRAYEEAGIRPGQADFDQALLRVAGDIGSDVLEAAAGLTSPAGRRLAAWLAQGGLPETVSARTTERMAPERMNYWRQPRTSRRVLVRTEAFPGHDEFPTPFRELLDTFDPHVRGCRHWHWPSVHDLAAVPWHREIAATRSLSTVARTADEDERGVRALLPALAEAGGAAGPAVHLALAYGLGARHAEDRLSAVDALLVLAVRGQLDPVALGSDLVELVGLGALKPQRIAESLREAARTGAHTTTWAILAAALPGLLARPASRGLSAVVTVAADCAERCAARGEIPQVTEVAGRPGAAQLVKQARRLRDQLGRP